MSRRFRTVGMAVTMAMSVAGMFVLTTAPAEARPSIAHCLEDGRPIGYARSKPDYNLIGNKPYYVSIESVLFQCQGWVVAKHIVHLDSRWLDLGTEVHLRISTKRSDGRWVGADRTMIASKNFSDEVYYQIRGTGGGTHLTRVHVKQFAEPGQTSVFRPSTAKAVYGPWNGPEAKPGS